MNNNTRKTVKLSKLRQNISRLLNESPGDAEWSAIEPVQVNNVVDSNAINVDPINASKFKPTNIIEFEVAIKRLAEKIEEQDYANVYAHMKKYVDELNDLKLKKISDKIEESFRHEVRTIIRTRTDTPKLKSIDPNVLSYAKDLQLETKDIDLIRNNPEVLTETPGYKQYLLKKGL